MQPDAVERAAEHQRVRNLGVEEWLHAEMIAGAEDSSTLGIPNREREVAEQMLDTTLTPHLIGAQDVGCQAGG